MSEPDERYTQMPGLTAARTELLSTEPPSRTPLRDAGVVRDPRLASLDPELVEWWLGLAADDAVKTAPKTAEYGGTGGGSADLRVMGYALAELSGMHEAPEPVKLEMACWFYALGKISRLISDYKQGDAGKADTWFDLGVYSTMARRIQETGRWP